MIKIIKRMIFYLNFKSIYFIYLFNYFSNFFVCFFSFDFDFDKSKFKFGLKLIKIKIFYELMNSNI